MFAHAISTVKKIPRISPARPPAAERLRLYGLYKQSMEGDVRGVMERPGTEAGIDGVDARSENERERERQEGLKWYIPFSLSMHVSHTSANNHAGTHGQASTASPALPQNALTSRP